LIIWGEVRCNSRTLEKHKGAPPARTPFNSSSWQLIAEIMSMANAEASLTEQNLKAVIF
jgi:hypothetical protein